MTGIVVLALALVLAASVAAHRLRTDGRFAGPVGAAEPAKPSEPAEPAVAEESPGARVVAAVPGAALGERATLLQFSSAFCAPCRTTRVVLADVAGREPGVAHVEVDAEQHLDLVRALDVRRTPTTLVLAPDGSELVRAAGAPTRQQVLAALPDPIPTQG